MCLLMILFDVDGVYLQSKKEVVAEGEVQLVPVSEDPNQDDDVVETMKRWDFIDDGNHKPRLGDRAPMFVPFRKLGES